MANTNPERKFITNVYGCARCGEDHNSLHFTPFVNPIVDADGTTWDWWVLCPKTQEPILMKQIEEVEEEK